MKKYIYFLPALLLCLVACEPKEIERGTMFYTMEEAIKNMIQNESAGYYIYDEANGGLNQFLRDYMTVKGDFDPVRERAKVGSGSNAYYLFSIDTIPTDGPGIYIRGRVTTDDYGGNFYKSMVIQQIVNGEQQALRLSVDMGNASGMYAIGQELLIRVNGLSIGKYANQPQLCVPTFNNNINASSASEKVGWAPGRIPMNKILKAFTRIGLPNKDELVYDEIDLATLVTTSNNRNDGYGQSLIDKEEAIYWDGKLVRVKNVHFTGQYADTYGALQNCNQNNPETDEYANVFGPTTLNVGYPQSRVITDGKLYFMVSTSEYAKYAHMYLPAAEYTGTVEGILGFYMDNSRYSATWKTWSISLRDLNDVKLTNSAGQAWTPIEYGTK